MQRCHDTVQFANGDAVAGARVTVTQFPGGAAATLYSDNGITALPTNVVRTDDTGEFSFYAANGRYTLSVAYGGDTDAKSDVILYDPEDDDGGGGGTGTVTSVAISSPDMNVSGSPITGAGTISLPLSETGVVAGVYTLATVQVDAKGRVVAAASGSAGSGVTSVTLTQPAAGLTLTNSGATQTGAASAVFALANDLAALEGLSSTGLARRTGSDAWSVGTAVATAEIADDAVTYAKMQNVSATSRMLGRKTAGSGDPEELTLSEALDFIGSAAHGDILYRGASAWARLAAGTSGHVLTTGGAGADPSWAAASGGSSNLPGTIEVTDEYSIITTGLKRTFRARGAFTLTAVRASLTTAQTSGAILTVDVKKNGTTIFTTKVTIDNTEKTSTTAATPSVLSTTSFADDDEITIIVDQIGDATATGLKVAFL